MKLIPLTKGKSAMVDDADYEPLSKFKWYAQKGHNGWYAGRSVSCSDGVCRVQLMHRAVLGVTDPKTQVDHRYGDGLNNQRWNLRVATHAENQHNRGKSKDNTSGYKGVSWNRGTRKWQAIIRHEGRKTHGGYFTTPIEAAAVYNWLATRFHGDFAQLNTF